MPDSNNQDRRNFQPLLGVRVVDFTWEATGPFATELLGWLGAEVIKVESYTRPDGMRRYAQMHAWTADPADLDASPYFNDVNLNKLSLGLNLKGPDAREVTNALIMKSDVLVQNMRPGVFDRIVGDTNHIRSLRPDVIVANLSARGKEGGNDPGYAAVFAALGGLSYLSGYEDGPPAHCRLNVDFTCGTFFALSIASALANRRRTGAGVDIDLSCQEVCAALVGDAILASAMGLTPIRGRGAPHGRDGISISECFPCLGDDEWISLTLSGDDDIATMSNLLGLGPPPANVSSDEEFIDGLRDSIRSWTVQRDKRPLMRQLQDAGLAAFASMNFADLADDEHLNSRNFWSSVGHPLLGPSHVCNPPWTVQGELRSPGEPAPMIGEHSTFVLTEILGIASERVDELVASGTVELCRRNGQSVLTDENDRQVITERASLHDRSEDSRIGDGQSAESPNPIVIEIGDSHAIQYCGRLLCELGTPVFKLSTSPRDNTGSDKSLSTARWLYENVGKVHIAVDPAQSADRALATAMADECVLVLTDNRPQARPLLDMLGSRVLNFLSVTPLGLVGDRADWRMYPNNAYHASGEGHLFPPSREGLERPPEGPWWTTPEYAAGALGALVGASLLFGLPNMNAQDRFVLDVSQQEYGIHMNKVFADRYWATGVVESRLTQAHPWAGIFSCQDGHIAILTLLEHQWECLLDTIGMGDLIGDPKLGSPTARAENRTFVRRLVEDWTRQLPRDRVVALLSSAGVPTGSVRRPDEVPSVPEMNQRGFFGSPGSTGTNTHLAGLPFTTTLTPTRATGVSDNDADESPRDALVRAGVDRNLADQLEARGALEIIRV